MHKSGLYMSKSIGDVLSARLDGDVKFPRERLLSSTGSYRLFNTMNNIENQSISVAETILHPQSELNFFSSQIARINNGEDTPSTYDLLRSHTSSPSRRDTYPESECGSAFDEGKLKKYYREISSTSVGRPDPALASTLSSFQPASDRLLHTADALRHATLSQDPHLSQARLHASAPLVLLQGPPDSAESRRWLEQELEDARALAIQQVRRARPRARPSREGVRHGTAGPWRRRAGRPLHPPLPAWGTEELRSDHPDGPQAAARRCGRSASRRSAEARAAAPRTVMPAFCGMPALSRKSGRQFAALRL